MNILVAALHRIIVEAGRKDKYLAMFNKTSPEFQEKAPDLVKWAMDTLEKDDRINWFIKRVRLADEEFREKDKKAKQAWSEERREGMAKQRDPIEWLQEKVGHYIGNAKVNKYGLVLDYTFKPDTKTAELLQKLQELEDESFAKKGKNARYLPTPDETFIKINDNWEWQIIKKGFCLREGRAMKHCGNEPSAKPGDNVLSLREKVEVDGKEVWQPHATFIINDGVLGEMKGFDNKKPGKDLHPYILKLLEDDRIKRVKGGGYAAKENFKFKDLSEQDLAIVEEKRPDLIENQGTPLEELAERIDQEYQGQEEYHRSEDNWGEYLSPDYTELYLDDVDDDVEELIERLKELTDDWQDELWNLGDPDLADMYRVSNEIASFSLGEREYELSDDLANEIDDLNDAEKEELKEHISSSTYISDDLQYLHIGGDYDRAILTIDEDKLEERVEELEEAAEMEKSDDVDFAETQVLENKSADVRRKALDKVMDQDVLETVALEDAVRDIQIKAIKKVESQDILKQIALDKEKDSDVRKAATEKVEDDEVLKKLAEDDGRYNYPYKEAFEKIKDLEYIKKEALKPSEDTWKQEIAAERIDDDKDFLRKLFRYELTIREKNHIQDRIIQEILVKLDPKEDAELFQEIARIPKQDGHWNRNTMQPFALRSIQDEEFLKDYIKYEEDINEGEEDPDTDFLQVAYESIEDENWLKEKLSETKERKLIPSILKNIKDQPFLDKYIDKAAEKFDEYKFTDIAEAVGKNIEEDTILYKIITHPKIWYHGKVQDFIEKMEDKKLIMRIPSVLKDNEARRDLKAPVIKRLKELGVSEEEIDKKFFSVEEEK